MKDQALSANEKTQPPSTEAEKDENYFHSIIRRISNLILLENTGMFSISGSWGIGKTHFLRERLIEEVSKRAPNRAVFYTDVHGVRSVTELQQKILLGKTHSPQESMVPAFEKGLKKLIGIATHEDIQLALKDINYLSLLPSASFYLAQRKLIGKAIVIIDEVERKNSALSLEVIVNFLEALCAENGCFIVLTLNHDKLQEPDEKFYKKAYEKYFLDGMLFDPSVADLFADYKKEARWEGKEAEIAQRAFSIFNCKNIRILQRYRRVCNHLRNSLPTTDTDSSNDVLFHAAVGTLVRHHLTVTNTAEYSSFYQNKYLIRRYSQKSNNESCDIPFNEIKELLVSVPYIEMSYDNWLNSYLDGQNVLLSDFEKTLDFFAEDILRSNVNAELTKALERYNFNFLTTRIEVQDLLLRALEERFDLLSLDTLLNALEFLEKECNSQAKPELIREKVRQMKLSVIELRMLKSQFSFPRRFCNDELHLIIDEMLKTGLRDLYPNPWTVIVECAEGSISIEDSLFILSEHGIDRIADAFKNSDKNTKLNIYLSSIAESIGISNNEQVNVDLRSLLYEALLLVKSKHHSLDERFEHILHLFTPPPPPSDPAPPTPPPDPQ
ncbi:MAG: hypothetical protein RLY93_16770 [Sumerlaeia bacterium]